MAIESNEILYLIWALVVSIVVILLVIKLNQLKHKHQIDILDLKKQKESNAYAAGQKFLKGDINQILGTFSLLSEYDDLILLSTTSRQASMDMIGINDEKMDVIEIKTKGKKISLSDKEKRIKKLVESNKVFYRIVEAELPKTFKMQDADSNK